MSARFVPLLVLTLTFACAPARKTVLVQRQAGIEGAWRTDRVIVKTKGDHVLIHYEERTFEILHFRAFRGVLEEDQVLLRGDRFEVRITQDRFEVGYKDRPAQSWAIKTMPKGKIGVFDGRDLEFKSRVRLQRGG